jgi:hypothetical protein
VRAAIGIGLLGGLILVASLSVPSLVLGIILGFAFFALAMGLLVWLDGKLP